MNNFLSFGHAVLNLNSNSFKNRQKIEAIRMLPSLLSSSHGNLIQKQCLMSGMELALRPERMWFTKEINDKDSSHLHMQTNQFQI